MKNTIPSLAAGTFLVAMSFTPCPASGVIVGHNDVAGVASFPQVTMDAIGRQKWLFTHASVGGNMIEGMQTLNATDTNRYQLTVEVYGDWSSVSPPPATTVPGTIYDAPRGNPGWQEKFAMFDAAVRTLGWRSPKVGIAMDKLCYIDQDANSTNYVAMMTALEADFPGTIFVYTTMPLESSANSANILRAAYNNFVRAHCQLNNRVLFDIADIESHDPSGNAVTFTNAGKVYPQMYSGYTSDGGHLNSTGEQRVALGWYATAAAIANTPAQPQWTTNNLPSGLVAWWPAETNANELISHNDGTLLDNATFASARFGNGFFFDGTNDAVTITHAEILNVPASGFTVEFWMKAGKDQPGAVSSIVDKDHSAADSSGWEVSCWRDSGRLSFGIGNGVSFPLCTNLTDVLDNQFHHVAFAWDRTNWLIYVDGILENSLYRPTVINNSRPLRFGYHWDEPTVFADRFYRGVLDEVRLYNRALSASEIAYVYSGIPWLAIARTNELVTLSWQTPEDGWVLEQTNALSGSAASWPQIPPPYQTNGGTFSTTVTNNPAIGSQFFRLHKP